MIKPEKAAAILKAHFAEVTPEQFEANLRRWCPELFEQPKANGKQSTPRTGRAKTSNSSRPRRRAARVT